MCDKYDTKRAINVNYVKISDNDIEFIDDIDDDSLIFFKINELTYKIVKNYINIKKHKKAYEFLKISAKYENNESINLLKKYDNIIDNYLINNDKIEEKCILCYENNCDTLCKKCNKINYCNNCIFEWLLKNEGNKCPICRN